MAKDDQTTLKMPPVSQEQGAIALARNEPSVAQMLAKVIEGGITADSVQTVERMIALYERMEDRKSEQAFNAAFTELQAATPGIEATKGVPDKHGAIKYHYAPYEQIMEKLQPLLTQFGFTISFDTGFAEGRITATCILRHTSGHSVRNSFAVRIGSGPPGSNEAQADGSARSYAKRGALCDALNIVIEHDDDARNLGTPISAEKADELKRRVRSLENVSEATFLKWALAKDYIEISTLKLEAIETWLDQKERKERSA